MLQPPAALKGVSANALHSGYFLAFHVRSQKSGGLQPCVAHSLPDSRSLASALSLIRNN